MITLCQANGDQSNWSRIHKALDSFGYPMSQTRCSQIVCGVDPLLDENHSGWDLIQRRIARAEGELVHADWEFPNHNAWNGVCTTGQRRTKKMLMDSIRAQGRQASMWGEPGFFAHSDTPITQTGTLDFRMTEEPDWIIQSCYLKKYLEDPYESARYASNVHFAANATAQISPGVQVYMAMQAWMRPDSEPHRRMNHIDVWTMARTLKSTGNRLLWWFECGNDDGFMKANLAEAERIAPAFMDGWNSISMKAAE